MENKMKTFCKQGTKMNYPKKNRFQSVPFAALLVISVSLIFHGVGQMSKFGLYNLQRENLVFKNSLCSCCVKKG